MACATLAGVGCGSDDSEGEGLPPEAVAVLDERLDEIQRRFDDATDESVNVGACNDIQNDSFAAIADTIDNLPDDVDPDVVDALNESFRRLQDLTQEGCADIDEPQTETETTPQETTPEETQTQTTPPEQTETLPAPEQPDGGTGDGDGDGDGGGSSGGGGGGGGGLEAPGGDG